MQDVDEAGDALAQTDRAGQRLEAGAGGVEGCGNTPLSSVPTRVDPPSLPQSVAVGLTGDAANVADGPGGVGGDVGAQAVTQQVEGLGVGAVAFDQGLSEPAQGVGLSLAA